MFGNIPNLIGSFLEFLFQHKTPLPQTAAAFEALAESIVPPVCQTTLPTKKPDVVNMHEYYGYIFDHYLSLQIIFKPYTFGLANATAKMLNTVASQLIAAGENKHQPDRAIAATRGMFAALATEDRCRAISLLEHLRLDLSSLPVPYYKSPGIVRAAVSILTMLGSAAYYSEWTGYGPTRSGPPAERTLAQTPVSWQRIGYPGPAKGYHALRGYLINKFTD